MSRPFHEIACVEQKHGEPRRRYWQSDYFDLFVWLEPEPEIWGFQLCYDRGYDEHALTWKRQFDVLEHHAIDEGSGLLGGLRSPILSTARTATPADLADRFSKAATTLPHDVRTLIERVLVEHTRA